MGAGISGLALAWRLKQHCSGAARIRLVEAKSRVGGTLWTDRAGGYRLETGPSSFLGRAATLRLCRELGLESDLRFADPTARDRYVFLGDHLRRLPRGPVGLLTSGLLGLRGKARLLAEHWAKPGSSSDETVYEFGCRRLGREATENLLDAVVTGIYAGDSRRLSLRACFPRLAKMELESGSLTRALLQRKRDEGATGSEGVGILRLATIDGGMGALVLRLHEKLEDHVELDRRVASLEAGPDGWRVAGEGWEGRFDVVALTCPAHEQQQILSTVDGELAREIGQIEYNSVVVCVLGYSTSDLARVPRGFGYLAPAGLGRAVLGVIFSSAVFPNQAPTGSFQFRAILGGSRRPDVVDWSDEAVVETVRGDLECTLGIRVPPSFHWIWRWPKAIPQYHAGHLARLERIESRRLAHPGLVLGGNAYRGAGVNDCIADAERLAIAVRDYLGTLAD